MRINLPKFNLPFLGKGKEKKKRLPEEKNVKSPLPNGIVLVGKHNLYQPSSEQMILFPIYTFLVPKCILDVAKGYDLYIANDDIEIDLTPLYLISLKECSGAVRKISPVERIEGKSIQINKKEKRGAKKVLTRWLRRMIELPLTCEVEMWQNANIDQRRFIALKLLKEYGEDLLFKAYQKWSQTHPDLTLCGMWREMANLIEKTIDEEKELKEWLKSIETELRRDES